VLLSEVVFVFVAATYRSAHATFAYFFKQVCKRDKPDFI